jgi:hypothetical protein
MRAYTNNRIKRVRNLRVEGVVAIWKRVNNAIFHFREDQYLAKLERVEAKTQEIGHSITQL